MSERSDPISELFNNLEAIDDRLRFLQVFPDFIAHLKNGGCNDVQKAAAKLETACSSLQAVQEDFSRFTLTDKFQRRPEIFEKLTTCDPLAVLDLLRLAHTLFVPVHQTAFIDSGRGTRERPAGQLTTNAYQARSA